MPTNAERKAAYRAKKDKEDELTASVVPPASALDEHGEPIPLDEPTVVVKGEEKPKPTLAERLGFGKRAKPATPIKQTRSRAASKSPNLMVTMLPVLLSSLIVTYAKDRLPADYQACAPTQEEAGSVLAPLMNIIGRRVSVAAKVSQDTIDVANAIICGFAYSIRAYITYVEIKKAKESGHAGKEATPTIKNEPEVIRTAPIVSRGDEGQPVWVNPVSVPASNGSSDTSLRDYEAGLVADLLKRDKQGRDKRGLV